MRPGRENAGACIPFGKYPNSSTKKVAARCFQLWRLRDPPDASTLENPLVVPVYVRYKCSRISPADHFPGGCQLSSSAVSEVVSK